MKLLAFECSAGPASCAVWEDGKILASAYLGVKITHSQTLIPMAQSVLQSAFLDIKDIDGFAVSCGPGSFTGVRIGLAAVKGLSQPQGKPCYGVSTLKAMAARFLAFDGTVCALMDARRDQFYNAVYSIKDKKLSAVCSDRAAALGEVEETLKDIKGKIILTGDGANLFYEKTSLPKENLILPGAELIYQNAAGVAMAAADCEPVTADKLFPVYLRLSQAERELANKN